MMRKIVIGLAAAAFVTGAATLSASAIPGGGRGESAIPGGGGGDGGGGAYVDVVRFGGGGFGRGGFGRAGLVTMAASRRLLPRKNISIVGKSQGFPGCCHLP